MKYLTPKIWKAKEKEMKKRKSLSEIIENGDGSIIKIGEVSKIMK